MSNGCPQVEALERIAAVGERLAPLADALLHKADADALSMIERFAAGADAAAGLGAAQTKLCDFLVNNRMKLTGGVFGIMVAAGVISPNLAAVVTKALHAVGWM